MIRVGFARSLLGVGLAAVLLAGCGGLNTAMSGAVPQSVMAPNRVHRASASSGDLLYVANEGSDGSYGQDVGVVTYPQGQPVMTITGIGPPWGICSDTSGNVWVVTLGGYAHEFPHGGTTEIARLRIPKSFLEDTIGLLGFRAAGQDRG
jgi:hypothetical protein